MRAHDRCPVRIAPLLLVASRSKREQISLRADKRPVPLEQDPRENTGRGGGGQRLPVAGREPPEQPRAPSNHRVEKRVRASENQGGNGRTKNEWLRELLVAYR